VFALAVNSWLLNRQFFGWVPQERIERLPLFGVVDVSTPTRFYIYSLVVLTLVYLALRGVRHSRTGRAILALRENELAAQAFSVPPVRVKLTAFVISGFVAGIAGGLFVHLSQSFDLTSYSAAASLDVFTAAVVGGLGSLFGGILGAVFLRGSQWFITAPEWRLLSSALGVLVVLLILPGGLASLVIKIRDRYVDLVNPDPTPRADPSSATGPTPAGDQVVPVDTALANPTPEDLEPAERIAT
jgi:branched-chain amino acid transport system permease protein